MNGKRGNRFGDHSQDADWGRMAIRLQRDRRKSSEDFAQQPVCSAQKGIPTMDLRLDDKTALVTGSTGGIGAAVAVALAREGAFVVVHGRNRSKAQAVVEHIKSAGNDAAIAIGDLDSDAGAESVISQAHAAAGHIDILVNNAGAYSETAWLETTPDQWLDTYNINVVSSVRLIRHLAPAMKERRWGRIIQMSSAAAVQPLGNQPNYSASKAAMLNMTVGLIRRDLANSGVTVNSVTPGIVVTEGVRQFFIDMARQNNWGDDWKTIVHRAQQEFLPIPAGRFGTPEDVGNLVTYLASPLADYINGANYRIDGGSVPTIN